MALSRTTSILAATSILALMSGCTKFQEILTPYGEAGKAPAYDQFGVTTAHNIGVHNGTIEWTQALAERFNNAVNDTINFEFNSAQLDAEARAILDEQAGFIRKFPEVRFRVYGHTDLVGSAAYNKRLGLRRAQAVVAYFATKGISRSRLEAVASYGETRPLVDTQNRERRNRRTVTEVSGFVEDAPLILDGEYAEIVWREYVGSATADPGAGGAVEPSGSGGATN
jgi:peptidoglycan-associated lipoprotein